MGYSPISDLDTVISNTFAHANVTGISGAPVRKYPSNNDLHSTIIRQTNGFIKCEQVNLITVEVRTSAYEDEEWDFIGFIYLDDGITATEFLDELQRTLTVNNQSTTMTSYYTLIWQHQGFQGTLQIFSYRINAEKILVSLS